MRQVEVGRITDADAAKCGRKCGRMWQETQPKCDRYVGRGGVLLGNFPEIFAFFSAKLGCFFLVNSDRSTRYLDTKMRVDTQIAKELVKFGGCGIWPL
eukprot:COSAG04_NODE_1041_length_8586_cov_3.921998_2_plen_98_part_00